MKEEGRGDLRIPSSSITKKRGNCLAICSNSNFVQARMSIDFVSITERCSIWGKMVRRGLAERVSESIKKVQQFAIFKLKRFNGRLDRVSKLSNLMFVPERLR